MDIVGVNVCGDSHESRGSGIMTLASKPGIVQVMDPGYRKIS